MWMRIAAALTVAGLAALLVTCGGDAIAVVDDTDTAGQQGGGPDTAGQGGATGATGDTYTIACALDGASGFDSSCSVEPREIEGVEVLAVFHPDGGFRRFEVLPDRAGLAAVAGADKLTQTLSGDTLEISIAGDRYRFPATAE